MRYEDLLGQPGETLERVESFARLPVDRDWLDHCRSIPSPRPAKDGRQSLIDCARQPERELLCDYGYL